MKVYLIRHGESIGNKLNLNQGQKNDFSLTEKGQEQSKKIAERLAKEKIDAIYTSDLKRAKETAQIIGGCHNIVPIADKRLRERDFGDLDDKKNILKDWKAHVKKIVEEKGLNPEEVKAPNGESDKDHWDRIQDFFNEKLMQHPNDTIVVVAHAGSNKVSLGVIGHFSKEEMYKTYQGNTGLNEFEHNNGAWKVKQVNNISHLEKDIEALKIFNSVKNEKPIYRFSERWKINQRLFEEFKKAGYRVKYIVCSFNWEDQNLPPEALELSHPQPDKHLIIAVKSHGIYQKLDLSNYTLLNGAGEWDTYKDSILSIIPKEFVEESQEESFAEDYRKSLNFDKYEKFYKKVSEFMKKVVQKGGTK